LSYAAPATATAGNGALTHGVRTSEWLCKSPRSKEVRAYLPNYSTQRKAKCCHECVKRNFKRKKIALESIERGVNNDVKYSAHKNTNSDRKTSTERMTR